MKSILFAVALVLFCASGARADDIPISGTAEGSTGPTGGFFQFSGSQLSVGSGTFDGIYGSCNAVGAICNIAYVIPSAYNYEGFFGTLASGGSLNGVNANLIGGDLVIFASLPIPPNDSGSPFDVSVPIAVAGTIQGYDLTNFPGDATLGAPLWNLIVSGTGEADFRVVDEPGGLFVLDEFATFSGTADPPVTTTPEPSSLPLIGTGLLSMLGVARRKWLR